MRKRERERERERELDIVKRGKQSMCLSLSRRTPSLSLSLSAFTVLTRKATVTKEIQGEVLQREKKVKVVKDFCPKTLVSNI